MEDSVCRSRVSFIEGFSMKLLRRRPFLTKFPSFLPRNPIRLFTPVVVACLCGVKSPLLAANQNNLLELHQQAVDSMREIE
jgi:hypothetical protein